MTIDEAIQHAREVAEIHRNNDKLNKTLGKGSPYYNTGCIKCAEEHEQLADWLEELKAIKEMDLSIPQHFTKEQSVWIKAYCIKRNIEFYNKAIDDFVDTLVSAFDETNIKEYGFYPENLVRQVAKQLKEGN